MRSFIMGWTEKAEALVTGNIIWSSASQLQEQIRAHQVRLRPKMLFSELKRVCAILLLCPKL